MRTPGSRRSSVSRRKTSEGHPRVGIRLLGMVAAIFIALGLPLVSTGTAAAGGGVNITGWCQQHYTSGAFNGVVVANNVYGWRCQYGADVGTRLNVDMNAACAYTYPGRPGSAR